MLGKRAFVVPVVDVKSFCFDKHLGKAVKNARTLRIAVIVRPRKTEAVLPLILLDRVMYFWLRCKVQVVDAIMPKLRLILLNTVNIRGENDVRHARRRHKSIRIDRIFFVPEDDRDAVLLAVARHLKILFAAAGDLPVPKAILALPCGFDKQEIGQKGSNFLLPAVRRDLFQNAFGRIAVKCKTIHHTGNPKLLQLLPL